MPRIRITGMLPQARLGQTFGDNPDPDDAWIRRMLEYEAAQGGFDANTGKAYGLSNWGYNAPKGYYYDNADRKYKQKGTGKLLNGTGVWNDAPKSIDEAIALYKKEYLPDIANLPIELRQRAGDFIYNSGRDYRVYMLDSYLKSIGKPGIANRSRFNADTYDPTKWTPTLKNEFETLWNQYSGDISKLPLDQQADLVDAGRDSYYQSINQVNGKPNPAYDATWKGRIFPKTTTPQTTTGQNKIVTINGVTYRPGDPGYDAAVKQSDEMIASVRKDMDANPIPTPNAPVVTSSAPTTTTTQPPTQSTNPTTKIDVPVFPTPTTPVDQPQQRSRFHPEWYDEGFDPETDLPVVAAKKTPYTIPSGPVATEQVPTINVQRQPGSVDIWANPTDISGTPQSVPVNPDDESRRYPIRYDEINKGTPSGINEEDIVDPRDYLRQQEKERRRQERKEDWEKFKRSKGVYAITHPADTIGKAGDWLNDKFTQGMSWLNQNKAFNKAADRSEKLYTNLMKVSPIIDYITDLQNQRRWNRQFTLSNLSDNLYAARPASTSGNRGDWDINTGIFRPNEIGFKSKGQYTNQFNYSAPGTGVVAYGGSINNRPMEKVRIRITGGTEKMATGGQPMTYSGQLGYGLNLGQKRIYTDMPPEKTETLNRTIKPVPREQANIEAEKGETVFGDIDGDGAMEHMMIGGKKHSEGGTPLNVPEGSFIFSDTKELIIKDRKILEKFSMPVNKKGYTPAEIAKKYDTTKYKAIIEDENSDSIKKATAQIMVKTFERRLAELALIQEQMKGFPQGIPEVAKKFFPDLQTKEDQQKQPGASENIDFAQQGQPQMQGGMPQEMMGQQMPQDMSQQPPMEEQMAGPQMEFGGMIPRFDLAGEVGEEDYNNPFSILGGNAANVGNLLYGNVGLDGGPGDPDATDQTYTPQQRAALSDPEFATFKTLLDKVNYAQRDPNKYKTGSGRYYVNVLTPEEAREFARLATKFGFRRQAEGNIPGYSITQGATPGYSFTVGKGKSARKVGFFGGFTPDLYERRVVEDIYGKEASDKMTDVERRKAYFKELGVDLSGVTDAQLANPKTLYQNRDFFLKKFYPAFTKTFAKEGFRPEMQDDMLIGAEHYDSYRSKPKPTDETVIGYKCTGRDKETGKANIISSSYMNQAAMTKDGAVASESEAYKQCPEEPIKPGKPVEPCPPGYYKDTNGKCVKMPFDYMTPDKVTMLATALGAPRKYLPWGQKLPFEPGDVVFKDWRAKAAERQSLINRMADQLNTYSPGAATASNLSFLAGQQAEGLIKDIDDVDSYNVQVANAFADRERQRKDQNNMINLAKAEELYKGNVIANQQYDNAKRQYFNNMAKAFGNAWKNRMYLSLLNSVNPMFNIDPWRGQNHFKGGYDENDLFNSTGFATTSSSKGTTYQERMADYLRRGYPKALAEKYAAEDDRKGSTASTMSNKQANLQAARALLSGYGTLGGGFNADEEAGVI